MNCDINRLRVWKLIFKLISDIKKVKMDLKIPDKAAFENLWRKFNTTYHACLFYSLRHVYFTVTIILQFRLLWQIKQLCGKTWWITRFSSLAIFKRLMQCFFFSWKSNCVTTATQLLLFSALADAYYLQIATPHCNQLYICILACFCESNSGGISVLNTLPFHYRSLRYHHVA